MNEQPTYEAPGITPIGTLHELTLDPKFFGHADGVKFGPPGTDGVPIGTPSP